ncbi:hypothetical protein AHAS_Ahas08G0159700 [Arachis hypogaea]
MGKSVEFLAAGVAADVADPGEVIDPAGDNENAEAAAAHGTAVGIQAIGVVPAPAGAVDEGGDGEDEVADDDGEDEVADDDGDDEGADGDDEGGEDGDDEGDMDDNDGDGDGAGGGGAPGGGAAGGNDEAGGAGGDGGDQSEVIEASSPSSSSSSVNQLFDGLARLDSCISSVGQTAVMTRDHLQDYFFFLNYVVPFFSVCCSSMFGRMANVFLVVQEACKFV